MNPKYFYDKVSESGISIDTVSVEIRCESCKFWSQTGTGIGECRRHAPIVTECDDSIWPSTFDSWWCGDYEPKDEEAA